MRAALLLALLSTPALANPVSVGVAPDAKSRVQLNGDLGLTASGLPTARAELRIAKSGIEARIAPLRGTSAGRLLDNGAATRGLHSAWDSERWLQGWNAHRIEHFAWLRPIDAHLQGLPIGRPQPLQPLRPPQMLPAAPATPDLTLRVLRFEDRREQRFTQLLVARPGQVHEVPAGQALATP